jgi:hypothetical protein
MNHTDINRRLALAIGYRPEDVLAGYVYRQNECLGRGLWRAFDYRDLETIYPIAEKFKMFPLWDALNRGWYVPPAIVQKALHDCPRACIALAVIEAKDRGLL